MCNCIEEAKNMQLQMEALYDCEWYSQEYVDILQELIERLEKKDSISEQSRYEIAMEVWKEFNKNESNIFINAFPEWLEEKNK